MQFYALFNSIRFLSRYCREVLHSVLFSMTFNTHELIFLSTDDQLRKNIFYHALFSALWTWVEVDGWSGLLWGRGLYRPNGIKNLLMKHRYSAYSKTSFLNFTNSLTDMYSYWTPVQTMSPLFQWNSYLSI